MALTFRTQADDGGGQLFAEQGDQVVGVLRWVASGEHTWIANSTVVDPRMRGQGIALKLVERFTERARDAGVRVRPTCSYVADAYRKHPELADVVAPRG